ncbi:hypothetical protein K474DRAFT_1700077 [Panus rudis PR-1116 ss-1]|nr:hypothetical protein K474DRAFT_1700077 [Panus rudis PR-1116 ss-1]
MPVGARCIHTGSHEYVVARPYVQQSYRRLEQYTEAKELCAVLLDALKVHEKAWTSAGVLHGDICNDNILIGRERTSEVVLIDWDMCKSRLGYTMNGRRAVGRGWRSGSWLFKSSVLSRYPLKDASVSDDIEAFMHIAHWFAIRFHRHMLKGSELHRHLQNFFLGVEAGAPCHRGTVTRYTTVKKNNLGIEFDRPRLQALLDTLRAICKEHYATFTEDQLRDWTPLGCQELETEPQIIVDDDDYSDVFSDLKEFAGTKVQPLKGLATLNNHRLFILAYKQQLAKANGWDSKDKLEDKFANLLTNDGERTVTVSSHQPTTSTSSKRASREDHDVDPASQAPTAKRAKVQEVTVTTLPVRKLDSVYEEEEELVD